MNNTEFICPKHKVPLKSKDNYAKSFGLQWNVFRKTQLDSYTISKD
ncbi:MAG: hypothetical protein ACD_79C00287G0006 [uncultured bacterium]|nr:MAG: hypothetical protein ACD_79C00287G0006 [uncultured bacterium]